LRAGCVQVACSLVCMLRAWFSIYTCLDVLLGVISDNIIMIKK